MTSRRSFIASTAFSGFLRAADAPVYRDHQNLLYWLDAAGTQKPVRSRKDWLIRRRHILAGMQMVMGPLPALLRSAPRVEPTDQDVVEDRFLRRKIRYEAEPGDWVPAWLLLPKGGRGRSPAVVCLHQTVRIGKDEPVGLGGKPNLAYAKELASRGYVAIAPDYPNFGEYKIDVYAKGYQSATIKGIHNHRRALDLLQSMKEVDGERLAVCGHSLGGHNSLFLAAMDERVKCAITSCGFTAFPKYYGGNLTGWSHKGYMPRIAEVYGKDPKRMPFDFPEILGVIARRAVYINAPKRDANFEVSGVADCVTAATAVYQTIYRRFEALAVEYPDAEHDFPPESRQRAYTFLDRILNRR
jgi:dienelactone hydrolase